MDYPPRLAHLATRDIVAAKLARLFADVHQIDEAEALDRLGRGLKGALWESLLSSAWKALRASSERLTDEALVEKVARALRERPSRLGRPAKMTPGLSALLLWIDLEAGTATDSARRVLESDEGRKRVAQGLGEAGALLAGELTRK